MSAKLTLTFDEWLKSRDLPPEHELTADAGRRHQLYNFYQDFCNTPPAPEAKDSCGQVIKQGDTVTMTFTLGPVTGPDHNGRITASLVHNGHHFMTVPCELVEKAE